MKTNPESVRQLLHPARREVGHIPAFQVSPEGSSFFRRFSGRLPLAFHLQGKIPCENCRMGRYAMLVALSAFAAGCAPGGTVVRSTDGWEMTPAGPLSETPSAVTKPDSVSWTRIPAVMRTGHEPAVIRVPFQPGEHQALYLPASTFSLRVYCSGRQIYSYSDEEQFLPGRFRGWSSHFIPLDGCKDSFLYFHVYSRLNVRFVVPHTGPVEDVARFVVSSAMGPFLVVVVCWVAGLAFLIPLSFNPDRLSAGLTIFLLSTGTWVFQLNPAARLIMGDSLLWTKAGLFCLYASPAGVALFVEAIMPAALFYRSRSACALFLGFAAGAVLLDAFGIFAAYRLILPFNMAAMVLALLTAVQLLRGMKQGRPEARILGAGVVVLIIFALHDIVLGFSSFSGVLDLRVSRLHFGMLAFIFSMIGVAAYRWRAMHRAIQDHSRELEVRVIERTDHLQTALTELRTQDFRMREELLIASSIQRQLLLSLPFEVPGLRLSGQYVPHHDVSGDFYDIFHDDLGGTVFFFADATGHGVPAALIMSMLKAIFMESAPLFDDPSWILAHMNSRLEKHLARTGNYVTGSVARISASGETTYANAANRPAILLRKGRKPEKLDADGTLLGAFAGGPEAYRIIRFQLDPGDRLLFYTDGLTEQSSEIDAYGEERLYSFLETHHDKIPSEDLCSRMIGDVQAFSGRAEFDDDVTICILERLQPVSVR